jgi:hypothetical protein
VDWLLGRLFAGVYLTLNYYDLRVGEPMTEPYDPVKPPPPEFDPAMVTTAPKAPHETAGVLRMYRNGVSVPKIMRSLGLSKETLMYLLTLALEDENEAHRLGQSIHDAAVVTCKTCGTVLTKIEATEFYRCMVCGYLHHEVEGAPA